MPCPLASAHLGPQSSPAQRYLKTALYGMTALLPDFALLCVCGLAGLGRVSREHAAVAVALEVPLAFVVTKVRLCVTREQLAVCATWMNLRG
jgi:GTPase